MDTTTNDAALVYAAREGDKAAFALLLDRHWSLLLSLCRRMTGDADIAQDVAQEAALHAFLSLDRLRQAEQFGPWLSGIGLNLCRHWLRQQAHAATSLDAVYGGRYDPTVRNIPDEHLGPEERAEMADLRTRVQRAVQDLPRGQRAAIVLFYLYGFTQAETAAQLGIAVGAVKTRLHKARNTLRQQLWQLWEDQEMTTQVESLLVDMQIDSVRRHTDKPEEERPYRHVIILKEAVGTRYLLLWVHQDVADALANTLEKKEWPRPVTFTFMANLLQAVDVTLREIQISKLVDDVFYATVVVEGPTGVHMVDARPSDALNLAAIVGAPIRAARDVLDTAGITVEPRRIQDENGQDVIEWTVRGISGQMMEGSHLDPVAQKHVRVVFRREHDNE